MPTNPYEPPKERGGLPRRNIWPWVCVTGVAAMLAGGLALCGTADFQQGGVRFLQVSQALAFAILFCAGALGLIVGSIGWLISRT
jgi:hypothetical protein